MNELLIKGKSGTSRILLNAEQTEVSKLIEGKHTFLLTDTNVDRLYPNFAPGIQRIVVPASESSKSLEIFASVIHQLLDLGADRNSFLLAFGGGMICDLCGFVASTFMRGVDFAYVPTSLLSQIDAGIGGKTGINLDYYKNIIGCFNQPAFVLIDPAFLQTLSTDELRNGCAEAIKHFAIRSAENFDWIDKNSEAILAKDSNVLAELVDKAARVKIEIVQRDELEGGERKLLNFGHSYGHAIETISKRAHGVCVAEGMILACKVSQHFTDLSDENFTALKNLIEKFKFPSPSELGNEEMLSVMKKDKKKTGEGIHFILLEEIGKAKIEELSFAQLKQLTF